LNIYIVKYFDEQKLYKTLQSEGLKIYDYNNTLTFRAENFWEMEKDDRAGKEKDG